MDKFKPRLTSPGIVEKKEYKKRGAGRSAMELAEESKKTRQQMEKIGLAQQVQMAEEENEEERLKQQPGESDSAFLERRRAHDREKQKTAKGGFAGEAKEKIRDYAKGKGDEAIKKARFAGKKFINKNASAKKIVTVAQSAKERAKELQERAKKIKEKANAIKEKGDKIAKRIQALKNRLKVKKIAEDKAKQLALRVARQTAMFALRIIIAVIGALSEIIVILFAVVLFVVIIAVAIDYACNLNFITGSFCSAVSSIASWF